MRAILERTIGAPADEVFPLCCPVEEYRWIDGWRCELVHCPNARVEEGTVFRETISSPFLQRRVRAPTTWTAVLHDPRNHRLHFELVNAISRSHYEIELSEQGAEETRLRLDFSYTAIDPRAERLIAAGGEAGLRAMLELLAEMLKHYAETREKLGLGALAKQLLRSDRLTFTDRLRIAANRLATALTPDPTRERLRAVLDDAARRDDDAGGDGDRS
jgi:hypothetical protein